MIKEFSLTVLYTQVLVHLSTHPSPGLLWSDEHVAQGFAWSTGIVGFGMPDHDGECLIRVMQTKDAVISDATLWAVQVPFEVSALLEIGTAVDFTHRVEVPFGTYALVFEALPGGDEHAYTVNLRFVATDTPEFAILKRGDALETDEVLIRNADLA
jgi:hypothetical protein